MSVLLPRRARRWLFLGLLAAVGLYFLYRVRAILPPFLFAIALTYLLNPMVNWLARNRLPRTWAIVIVYLVVAAGLLVGLVYGVPAVAREIAVFTEGIPQYTERIQELLDTLARRYHRTPLPESVRRVIDENIRRGEVLILQGLRTLVQGLVALFSQVLSLIVAPILAFYFLQDSGGLTRRIKAYVPPAYQEEVLALFREINQVLQNFVLGRLLVALVVGLLTFVGLALIGMEFALVLGLIAGIADLIPYFGPILGALPAVLLAGMESARMIVYTVIVFLVVQQIESNILSPLILGESVGLHPVLVIFALLAGGHLYGVWGVLLAIPVAAILRLLLRYAYRHLSGTRE